MPDSEEAWRREDKRRSAERKRIAEERARREQAYGKLNAWQEEPASRSRRGTPIPSRFKGIRRVLRNATGKNKGTFGQR
jgi:hypothetical protein